MGTKERELIKASGIKIDALIKLLNRALADEWLAYYQYWIGAKVVRGLDSEEVAAELEEHAEEELKHAKMLADRIIQLDGVPILEPKEWYDQTNCGYSKPEKFDILSILAQNIHGERCAIAVYKKLLDLTDDKDLVTYNMILEIYEEEIEHEQDLEIFQRDFLNPKGK